jgi:membrane protease YdiL (CAAX protease family)
VYCKKTGYRPFKNEFESSEKAFSQSRGNLHSVFVFLFAVCAVVSAVNVVGSLTDVVLSLFGVERASTLPANIGEFALTFVKTVIFAPVLEELLFRGAIIHAFSDRSDRFKIIVSALLFALMHYSILTLPYAFAAGGIISFFAVKQKSLKYSIVLHFCFNLTTFLFSVMAAILASDVYSAVSLVSFCVFLAIAVCGGVRELLIARGKDREVKRGVSGALAPEIMLYIIFAAVVSIINF